MQVHLIVRSNPDTPPGVIRALRLVGAPSPSIFEGDGREEVRAIPWPRAANRGRFSFCMKAIPQPHSCLKTELCEFGQSSIGESKFFHERRATFWQIETTRACDFNAGRCGVELAMIFTTRHDQTLRECG